MRIGNFSARIPQGNEKGSGHVYLPHGSQYTVDLRNQWYDRDCDATLTIDGKDMGTYRVPSNGSVVLERSSADQGKFTFFADGTAEAAAAGILMVDNPDRGLVSVRFRPAKARMRPVEMVSRGVEREEKTSGGINIDAGVLRSFNAGLSPSRSGITGLTGHSNQQFREVPNLDYDQTEEVVINLRLVPEAGVRPMEPVGAVKSNVVPQPLG